MAAGEERGADRRRSCQPLAKKLCFRWLLEGSYLHAPYTTYQHSLRIEVASPFFHNLDQMSSDRVLPASSQLCQAIRTLAGSA